jgi:hypothetical protein
MIQGRGSAGLAPEAFQRLALPGKLLRQKLQRHGPAQSCILGLVHHAHSALAKFLKDRVVGDGPAYHKVASRNVDFKI